MAFTGSFDGFCQDVDGFRRNVFGGFRYNVDGFLRDVFDGFRQDVFEGFRPNLAAFEGIFLTAFV